jgi:GntR family transcriptional regulator, transcriptional repressor for pyruvate dehydrogenase complex
LDRRLSWCSRLSRGTQSENTAISIDQKIPPFTRRLISDIVWKITRRELAAGAQLPSIEDLARQYDVGRSTIRESIRFVESTGLVQTIHGKGTFVFDFSSAADGVTFYDQIVDVRKMIELHATRRAAVVRTDADIDALEELLEEMRETRRDFQRFIDADRAFHSTIIKSARNPLLPAVFQNISGLFMGVQNALIHIDPDVAENSIVQHRAILDAIIARNVQLALDETESHLEMISTLFRKAED